MLNYQHTFVFLIYFLFSFVETAGSNNDVTLLSGSHAIPFQFLLPINLPGSFEGDAYSGYVRHWLKAVADRSRKVNREHTLPFTVASVLDLNAIENADVRILSKCMCT